MHDIRSGNQAYVWNICRSWNLDVVIRVSELSIELQLDKIKSTRVVRAKRKQL